MALHGSAERAVEVEPYRTYELGPFEVSFTPSVHSKLLLGLAVPYDGELTCDHLDALSPGAYRCGQVWGITIEVAGLRFYHQGSANLIDEAVRERGVDVFLAGVAGRSFTDDYWQRILPRLDPRAVVPTHYDNFFRPLGEQMEFVANVQLARLPEEIGAVSRDFELAGAAALGPSTLAAAWRRSARPCPSCARAGAEGVSIAFRSSSDSMMPAARQPVELATLDRQQILVARQGQRLLPRRGRSASPAGRRSGACPSTPPTALGRTAPGAATAASSVALRRKTGTS